MVYNQTLVFGTVIFLLMMYIASYCVLNHRFRNLVFWTLYFIAIAPNLLDFAGFITREGLINGILMVFFAAPAIFVLLLTYLGALCVMAVRNWQQTRRRYIPYSPQTPLSLADVQARVRQDLSAARVEDVQDVLQAIENSASAQVPLTKILQTHTTCQLQAQDDPHKQVTCFLDRTEALLEQYRQKRAKKVQPSK